MNKKFLMLLLGVIVLCCLPCVSSWGGTILNGTPSNLCLSSDGSTLLVALFDSNVISLLDANTLSEKTRIEVGMGPQGIAVS
ncbi:MAG TPA: hypothetical protein ENL28_01345, partial [Candidatus Atribacteria bacterium]|nr:hypothetical protein [Candidatus Atribacteria bacterium]